jgi:2-oxoglutarate ferredoxin oxidoreductase subunit alpha
MSAVMENEIRFMKGCEVLAEAAIRAGCRFFAGYPITPQNELLEYMSRYLPAAGGNFVQSESEIAAINMVYGASACGIRAMTSSSSPGISLKTEGISYMAAARLPGVIVSVQRGGPGLGTIQPAQADYYQAVKAPGHGGHRCMVFTPANMQELADIVSVAFEKSDRDRNPVIILIDGCLASVMEKVVLPNAVTPPARSEWALREKALPKKAWISPGWAIPEALEEDNLQRAQMYQAWQETDVMVEEKRLEDAEIVLTGYGTSARTAESVMESLREKGISVGLIKPLTVNPFPVESYRKLSPDRVKCIVDIEMAEPAQMKQDIIAANAIIPVISYTRAGGVIPTSEEVEQFIKKQLLA